MTSRAARKLARLLSGITCAVGRSWLRATSKAIRSRPSPALGRPVVISIAPWPARAWVSSGQSGAIEGLDCALSELCRFMQMSRCDGGAGGTEEQPPARRVVFDVVEGAQVVPLRLFRRADAACAFRCTLE